MRLERTWIAALFLVAALACPVPAIAQAPTPRETLGQLVADLQKNPGDDALREKIVRHARTMSPAPPIPEAARRHYVMGRTLFADAKNLQDYADAISKFRSALTIAPWWADAYAEMGLALEAAQRYDEAIKALTLYIAADPDGGKSRNARDEIYIIEARKEKAAGKSGSATTGGGGKPEATGGADREARTEAERDALSGRWKFQGGNECDKASHVEFRLDGDTLVHEVVFDRSCESFRAGNRVESARYRRIGDKTFRTRNEVMKSDITLQFDGNTIVQTYSGSGTKVFFRRE